MYEQNHAILTNQSAMMAHLKMPNPPAAPSPLIAYEHWNARGISWDIDVPEDATDDEDAMDEDEEALHHDVD